MSLWGVICTQYIYIKFAADAPAGQHGQQGQPQPTSGDDSDREEKEKHWWQKEEHKKQLGVRHCTAWTRTHCNIAFATCQIGGGILAGALAVGAGYAAYKHHENKKKAVRSAFFFLVLISLSHGIAQNLEREDWLEEARERTQAYNSGKGGRLTWALTSGHDIPRGAVEGGREEHGEVLYIARAFQGVRYLYHLLFFVRLLRLTPIRVVFVRPISVVSHSAYSMAPLRRPWKGVYRFQEGCSDRPQAEGQRCALSPH